MTDAGGVVGAPRWSAETPRSIMERLVADALRIVDADRCTLTSLDRSVMRVEASRERDGGAPVFVGAEYPLAEVQQQPLLREAVTTGDIVTGTGFSETASGDEQTQATLTKVRRVAIIPLSVEGTVIALLLLSRYEDRDFERAELDLMRPFGALAAVTLHSVRLLEEVSSTQRRALDALTQISQHLAASGDPTAFFLHMTDTIAGLAGGRRAAFWILEGNEVVAQPAAGFSPEQLRGMRLPFDVDQQPRLRRVMFGGEAVRFSAGDFDPPDPMHALVQLMEVQDGMAVPWRTAEQTIGVLMAYDAVHGWGGQEEWMLRLCARTSALVWQGYEAERRAAELSAREVERMAEHASRIASLDEQKSEFLRLASHELRTPMTLVRGYLSMLEEGTLGQLPPEAAAVLPIMSSRTAQMGHLVEQMLMASRAEEAGFQPQLAAVDVVELVGRVSASLRQLPRAAVVTVTGSQPAVAAADPEKTGTILENLLSNAIKYSPDNDAVDVRVTRDGELVRVAVTDHGIGISGEDMATLFQPFGRVRSAQTEAIEGTGLGLYLARRLARQQGGDIEVASQPGTGSTFTLVLRAAV
ncbi:MAG: GAF domain-containing protein [Candidatus Dormibacteraeota bacterium]|nr:GAF domain-containing protein [Candidatus Dormibacteraeota bacterium]MBV8446323.1 GAF domain-containing protein [Candidatus Dormibacteraeota bacterium]